MGVGRCGAVKGLPLQRADRDRVRQAVDRWPVVGSGHTHWELQLKLHLTHWAVLVTHHLIHCTVLVRLH